MCVYVCVYVYEYVCMCVCMWMFVCMCEGFLLVQKCLTSEQIVSEC